MFLLLLQICMLDQELIKNPGMRVPNSATSVGQTRSALLAANFIIMFFWKREKASMSYETRRTNLRTRRSGFSLIICPTFVLSVPNQLSELINKRSYERDQLCALHKWHICSGVWPREDDCYSIAKDASSKVKSQRLA